MTRPNPISNEDVERMLETIDLERDRVMLVLGCRTGFRVSELLSLRVQDVVQHGKIRNQITVQRRNTKCKIESRSVVLHPQARKYLDHYVKGKSPTESLFPITRQHAHRIIKGAADKAKVEGNVSCGSMRKAFAKKVYLALGKDLINTQRALGHKNIASTAYYLHFDQDEVNKAILGDE